MSAYSYSLYSTEATQYVLNLASGILTKNPLGTRPLVTASGNRTDTVKRVKPVDPLANPTVFTTKHALATWDVVTSPHTFGGVGSGRYETWTVAPASWFFNTSTTPGSLASPASIVDGKLREAIKAESFNLAQNCAEYRQACGMFAGLASDVYRVFHTLRRGRGFETFVRALQNPRNLVEKNLANSWLAYQFGWKPLISDLHAATELAANRLRSGIKKSVNRSATVEARTMTNGGGSFGYAWFYETRRSRKLAHYQIRDESLAQLAQVGITNPALLVWELVPYSFVIDWMFPVGNFLASLDALVAVSNLKVTVTDYQFKSIESSYICGETDPVQSYTRQSARTVQSTLGLPRLTYEPSKSLTAVLNGLALLGQLKSR